MLKSIELNSTTRMPQASASAFKGFHGVGIASEIGGDRDRIARRHQPACYGVDTLRIDAAKFDVAIARRRVGRHLIGVPLFRQRFPRQHHVDRSWRRALHESAGARQRFLHDDA